MSQTSQRPEMSAHVEPTREWAARTVKQMSLEQKVRQLFVTYAYGATPDSAHPKNREKFGVDTPAEVVRHYQPGGLIHFAWTESLHNPTQIAELANGLQRAALDAGAGIPLLISVDQEQGLINRVGEPATQFPGSMALGAGRTTADAERAASVTGQELRAMGFNQDYAPVADVNVNPANPVIGVRSFSSDPNLVARLTGAQVRGYQESGPPGHTVCATVKHFPGHGDTNVDSHSGLPVIKHTRDEWNRLDAPPFHEAVAKDVDAIMSAHIVVPGLDDSGGPSTLAPAVLTGLLRGELGFRGVIITDALDMGGAQVSQPEKDIPALALLAGADQLLMPPKLQVAINGVLKAVASGRLTEQRIDQSVERILRMKAGRGVVEDPFVEASAADQFVGRAEHRKAAQEITDRTTNVLRNETGLLPLRERPARALVTGPTTLAAAALGERMRTRKVDATVLATNSPPTEAQISQAVDVAHHNDLTVVLTNRAWKASNASQLKLVRELQRAGVRLVAVAVGDPYDAAYVDEVQTWIATFSSTPVAMESLAKVLFGELSPRGKLPVPIPDPNHPGTDRYPFDHCVTW